MKEKQATLRKYSALTGATALFIASLIICYSVGVYRWTSHPGRTIIHNTNPIVYPLFTTVRTTHICCSREPYYKLWRTYDYVAESHVPFRKPGVFLRVPAVYVHGNGGSYFCARSAARFVYEANVRTRQNALMAYRRKVRQRLESIIEQNSSLSRLKEGERYPTWLQHQAEHAVVREEMPLLGLELFSIDFLEESFAHNGVLILKEARFLNHSLHVLMDGFMSTFETVVNSPSATVFDRAQLSRSEQQVYEHPYVYPLQEIENDYVLSICNHSFFRSDPQICSMSKTHVKRFASLERVRLEVLRVKKSGFWVWTESLGGIVALTGALLSPHLVAGVVVVAAPTNYPPLFFDEPMLWLYRAISDAVLRHYPVASSKTSIDWERDVLGVHSVVEQLRRLSLLPSEELAARLASTPIISINGGWLDDIVPSISSHLIRTIPRLPGWPFHKEQVATSPASAYRRDVSTETLKGYSMPLDHRGLVYSTQFLQRASYSFAQAALLPEANAHLGIEPSIPHQFRDRLFPSMIQTYTRESYNERVGSFLFASSVRDTISGGLLQGSTTEAINTHFTEVCVDSESPFDFNKLPLRDEAADNDYYNGSKPLHVLIGFTTVAPEKVLLEEITLFQDREKRSPLTEMDFIAFPASRILLPTHDAEPPEVDSRTLRTAISFRITRIIKRHSKPFLVWPRFCFLVDKDDATAAFDHQSFLQYDIIDPFSFQAARTPGVIPTHYVGNPFRVESNTGYTLVDGVNSLTLETRLTVEMQKSPSVFPATICASLHSFYLAVRGNSGVAPDEPEAQLQIFHGPFRTDQSEFSYSWKAATTYPGAINQIYIVYTLADPSARPRVRLLDMEDHMSASFFSFRYWKIIANSWPQRWMAFFFAYSVLGRFCSSYVHLFTGYIVLFGAVEMKFCPDAALRSTLRTTALERISPVRRVLYTLVAGVLFELVLAFWADYALRVCRDPNPPPLSNLEMTQQMGLTEKLTLVFLFWLKPDYRECQYRWISAQSVPAWTFLDVHLASMLLGFGMSGVLLTMEICIFVASTTLSLPVRKFVLHPLIRRYPPVGAAVLSAIWATPIALFFGSSHIPISYIQTLALLLAMSVVALIPRTIRPGFSFWWLGCFMCVFAHWITHFDGVALTLRNHIVMGEECAALYDEERYHLTTKQQFIFAFLQFSLGMLYVMAFLLTRHEASIDRSALEKKRGQGDIERRAGSEKETLPKGCIVALGGWEYMLGDVGRAFPRVPLIAHLVKISALILVMWSALVSMRRPIDGSLSTVGLVLIITYLVGFIMKHL